MEYRTLKEENYLEKGDTFHFARRTLEPGPVRVLHDHDYFEFFWIVGGRVIHLINGAEVILEPGHGALIRPHDRHGFSPIVSAPGQLVNVMFQIETAAHLRARYEQEFADRYFWTRAVAPYDFQLDSTRLNLLDRWAADLEAGGRGLARIEGFLLRLLTQLIPSGADPQSEIPLWLTSAIEAARQPEVFRRGAQGLISAAGRSHEHVCRSLKFHLGATPSALINQMRMDHASRLLSGSDLSAAAIAAECGLENMSHFHTLFRQQFGVTPRRYRVTHQRDPVQPYRTGLALDRPASAAASLFQSQ